MNGPYTGDPARLRRVETDLLVVGGGIAGLFTALQAARTRRVLLLTKEKLAESATHYAQGGIAAAIDPADSPAEHAADTLAAGDGLCDPEAVRLLTEEGPRRVRELIAYGVEFDRAQGGGYQLGREGAHSRRRILHAHGDATGAEVARALAAAATAHPRVEIREDCLLVDLWVADGRCRGAVALDASDEPFAVAAGAVVLATGGAGQLFAHTTNPPVATADGLAVAYRAGAVLADLEFIQFHPTALAVPGNPRPLVSEAVRGEGALLYNARGERFMPRLHPLAELAPRDVVARAIYAEMQASGADHVLLDITRLGAEAARRFPGIAAACLAHGIDIARDRIPVSPAAHYHMGGVLTDRQGRTSLPGLYACGEVACTGVHGANRLASNSLLEALVWGARIAADLATPGPWQPPQLAGALHLTPPELTGPGVTSVPALQALMWRSAGLVRDAAGLERGLRALGRGDGTPVSRAGITLANLRTVAALVLGAALARCESRGGHFRSDSPRRDDAGWQRRILVQRPPAQ